MKKKNTNRIVFPLGEIYLIHNEAKNLVKIVDPINDDPVMIRWTIIGKSFKKLKKFYQFFVDEFVREFQYTIEFDDHISVKVVDESASVWVVLIMQRPSVQEIFDVSKFVYKTAKVMDCKYYSVGLNFIPDDDPSNDY